MRTRSSIILVILFCFSAFSSGRIIRVPQDYASIQLAINASVNGDTVLVDEGTYVVNLVLTKKIVLTSRFLIDGDTAHIGTTILDGSGFSNADSASVITIDGYTDTTTVVCGFTITKGSGNRRYNNGPGTIGWWRVGSGIDVTGGGARIKNNRIVRNNITSSNNDNISAAVHGWDIHHVYGISYVILESNLVADNVLNGRFVEAAGIAVAHPARIVGNTVVRNTNVSVAVRGLGGGLSISSSNVTIDQNLIANNLITAGNGGGLSIYGGLEIRLTNNIIAGNSAGSGLQASGRGGGFYLLQYGSMILINNTICNNEADSGSACYITGTSTLRALNTIFAHPSSLPVVNMSATSVFDHCFTSSGEIGTNGISGDPKFTAGDTLYRLQASSPAVAHGAVSASVGGITLNAPAVDYQGNVRPSPSWSKPDMGAMESPYALTGFYAVHRVPQDFATIQNAINSASHGDLVIVSEGTYKENLVINKKITLASLYYLDKDTSHISKTILDGGSPAVADSASVIIIGAGTDSTTQITGFTIQNGRGTRGLYDGVYWRSGLGIFIVAGAARVSNNVIANNSLTSEDALFGGGMTIFADAGPIGYWIVENNLFIHNNLSTSISNVFAGSEGGAAALSQSGRFCYNTVFENSAMHTGTGANVYGSSGGIQMFGNSGTSEILFANNVIRKNRASRWAGGLYAGQYINSPLKVTFLNNIISANTASGSAIVLSGGEYTFINNTITDNQFSRTFHIETLNSRGPVTLRMLNNIIWNPNISSEILFVSGTHPFNRYTNYNLVRSGISGTGNINADPLFVSGDSLYRLTAASPAICGGIFKANVGSLELTAPLNDYLGYARPRPAGTRCDMGAIEHDSGKVQDPTEVRELSADHLPETFMLSQNYPNPFNPSTTIRYALSQSGKVKLVVFDLLGREITTLVDVEQSAGWKEVVWNAKNVSSGIYFYSLQADNFNQMKKMVLIK
jgi:hypothetical protein